MKLTHPTNLANFSCLDTSKEETVYFSYETPIAFFQANETPLIVKNQWGPTTGRHINKVKREVIGDFHEVSHEFLMSCLNQI